MPPEFILVVFSPPQLTLNISQLVSGEPTATIIVGSSIFEERAAAVPRPAAHRLRPDRRASRDVFVTAVDSVAANVGVSFGDNHIYGQRHVVGALTNATRIEPGGSAARDEWGRASQLSHVKDSRELAMGYENECDEAPQIPIGFDPSAAEIWLPEQDSK